MNQIHQNYSTLYSTILYHKTIINNVILKMDERNKKKRAGKIRARQEVNYSIPPEEDPAMQDVFRFAAANPRFTTQMIARGLVKGNFLREGKVNMKYCFRRRY